MTTVTSSCLLRYVFPGSAFPLSPASAKGPDSLADLSAQVSDAVVNISATQSADTATKHGKHDGQKYSARNWTARRAF